MPMFRTPYLDYAAPGRVVRWLRRALASWPAAGLNLLLPPRCACCDADLPEPDGSGILLCGDCRKAAAPDNWPGCPRCGARIDTAKLGPDGCACCQGVRLWFDTLVPLGSYHGGLRRVVLRMKQGSQVPVATAMGRLLAECRASQLASLAIDVIVPVPMYWTRKLRRGNNSPEILACELGRSLDVPVAARLLTRSRNTLPQKGLPRNRRFQNVRGAFRVRGGYDLEKLRVLLVDDTLTTGATCSEAARVLKQAGASMVAAAVVARAQGADQS